MEDSKLRFGLVPFDGRVPATLFVMVAIAENNYGVLQIGCPILRRFVPFGKVDLENREIGGYKF